ncbi:porin [Blastopirellula sp. J2-11]|uniref:porin n=1 Tax=Blastopirellula sp. J2-11 TaxID=2943192 RepID=UPI0021CA92BE|nr:porin [Blastopirellula sp. J2-11]UUO07400.1 porin [Blastopirellula sp. J2-11]
MKTDWKTAMLAVGMLVGSTTFAVAQQPGYYNAGKVSYVGEQVTVSDCGCATDTACDSCGGCDSCNSCGCQSSCCGIDWFPCCGHGDQWSLFGENDCGVTIGGWVSGGFYANAGGVRSNTGNDPVAFRGISNTPTVDQVWIYAEKLADAETYCFDLGYRADFVWGADGPDTQSFGHGERDAWDNGWDTAKDLGSGTDLYGSAIPQLYGTAAWGDWEVKVGHFYTTIGYEVVTAPDNFFYSHAYTMNYGEPFTHTGAMATYSGIENLTLNGGWVAAWDTGFDFYEAGSMFLGGASATLSDKATLTWQCVGGSFGKNGGDSYMNSFVFDYDLGCGWNYVFQHDLGVQYNLFDDAGAPADNAYWYGINQYLFKEINECWKVGTRVEWFDDEDGSRVGNGAGSYYAFSVGANWTPNANLIVRPELRWDKFDNNTGATPFYDGAKDNGFFGGMDVILLY